MVVTFAVDGDMIYTAVGQKPKTSTALKRLRNVGENPWVTMLADEYSDDWETLWWVRADGRAAILADQAPPPGPVLAATVQRWTATATPTATATTASQAATPGATLRAQDA